MPKGTSPRMASRVLAWGPAGAAGLPAGSRGDSAPPVRDESTGTPPNPSVSLGCQNLSSSRSAPKQTTAPMMSGR